MVTRTSTRAGRLGWVPSPVAWSGAVFVAVLALLQTSVAPYFPILGARPALVLVSVVIFATLQVGPRSLVWGFGGGLLVDLFSAAAPGTNALLFTLIAYAAGSGGFLIDRTHLVFPLVAVALATLLYYPALLLALQLQGFDLDWSNQLGSRLLPAIAVNALAAIVIYPIVRQFERWIRPFPGLRFRGVR